MLEDLQTQSHQQEADSSLAFDHPQSPQGDLYLRFAVPSGAEFALPAAGIQEVMQQSVDKIAPVPNASPLMLGAINLRGQVIWVADLGKFLEDPAELKASRGDIDVIIIEESQDTIVGLAVNRLGEMEWLDIKQLQPGSNIPDAVAPYVQGEWRSETNSEEVIRLLNYSAILRSARWAV